MTIEIPKEKWTKFFDDLSRRRFGWKTDVEVMSESVGDQILSDDLPLNGIVFEEKAGRSQLEISLGETADNHQTHTISNPSKIVYLDEGNFLGGVVEIEEEKSDTKTLIKLLNPMPIYVGYADYEIVMASGK